MKQNYDFDIKQIKNLSKEEKTSRQKDLDLFYKSGFPSKQIEDWKGDGTLDAFFNLV